MPNLYFTRDPFAMIGNGVSINRMYSQYAQPRDHLRRLHLQVPSGLRWARPSTTSRDMTRSTSRAATSSNINEHDAGHRHLPAHRARRHRRRSLDNIFNDPETSPIDTILAFNIPVSRAFMHLDTVFTQIDRRQVHHPSRHHGTFDRLRDHPGPGKGGTEDPRAQRGAFRERAVRVRRRERSTLIPCGGGDRIAAEREQWNDGSNTLCRAPRHRRGLPAQQRHQRRAARERASTVSSMPSAELSPRPWRPALHVHARLARGLTEISPQAATQAA